jgi:predicted Zn-dependent protease
MSFRFVVASVVSLALVVPGIARGDDCLLSQTTTSSQPAETQSLPPDQKHLKELEADVELGRKAAEQVEKQEKLSTNQDMVQRVQRIADELTAIANRTEVRVPWGDKRVNPFVYSVKVLQGNDVNAFSLPGGFIYVYEGLIKSAESDDELAGVIAHEIAHVSMRHLHTLEREYNKVNLITIPLVLITILAGTNSQDLGNVATGAGLLGQALGSGWSQQAEMAADSGAFQFLQKSSYNPVGLLTFMERLAFQERLGPSYEWGIYRTHPPSPARAFAIAESLRAAKIPIRRSLVASSMRATIKPGDAGTVDVFFGNQLMHGFAGDDALQRAEKAVENLNQFFDAVPALFEVTIRDDAVIGRGAVLFSVTEEDAAQVKKKRDDLIQDALRSIRRAIFALNQRVLAGS